MPNLEDTTLSKYQVIRQIGSSNISTVYLGHDPFIDRPVAIKVANLASSEAGEDKELYRKLFFNEAQTAGMLRHPNITSIYDAGVDNGNYYIVMEYVHGGGTLEQYCTVNNLLPLHACVTLLFKTVTALAYAHKKSVIHRDIKPRNILLTHDLDVKLSDFGIASLPGTDATEMLRNAGSPMYMSPEQVRGDDLSPQSDLFSLGIVMYELLTGKHPFNGENLEAIQHQILNTTPPQLVELRSEIPEILQRIIDRALAKQISKRYKSGDDMAGDLSLVFDFIDTPKNEIGRQEKFNTLRGMDFFSFFTDTEVWELINAGIWQCIPEGENIILEGEVDKSFYVIVEGEVQVSKTGRYLDKLVSGDCFGEMGFISGQKRSATIKALTDVTILKVHAPLIERASVNCQLRFHKLFLNTMIERLCRATDRIVSE